MERVKGCTSRSGKVCYCTECCNYAKGTAAGRATPGKRDNSRQSLNSLGLTHHAQVQPCSSGQVSDGASTGGLAVTGHTTHDDDKPVDELGPCDCNRCCDNRLFCEGENKKWVEKFGPRCRRCDSQFVHPTHICDYCASNFRQSSNDVYNILLLVYVQWSIEEELTEPVGLKKRHSGTNEAMLQQQMWQVMNGQTKNISDKARTLYQHSNRIFEAVRCQGLVIGHFEGIRLQPDNALTQTIFLDVASYCRFGIVTFLGRISDLLARDQAELIEKEVILEEAIAGLEECEQIPEEESTYLSAVQQDRLAQ